VARGAREARAETAEALRAHLAELSALKVRNFLEVAVPAQIGMVSLGGRRFGAYSLDTAIGHGGMGTVRLAHRSDWQFEGLAAIKLLNTALVGHPSEKRLSHEGRVLARLQHPNIAHLLDAGLGANSRPYLILEYIRDEPIDQFCAARNLGNGARSEKPPAVSCRGLLSSLARR
jgi:serine/threonine protein kinase